MVLRGKCLGWKPVFVHAFPSTYSSIQISLLRFHLDPNILTLIKKIFYHTDYDNVQVSSSTNNTLENLQLFHESSLRKQELNAAEQLTYLRIDTCYIAIYNITTYFRKVLYTKTTNIYTYITCYNTNFNVNILQHISRTSSTKEQELNKKRTKQRRQEYFSITRICNITHHYRQCVRLYL